MPLFTGCRVNNIGATVNGENIPLFEPVVAGNTVHHLVVYGGANTGWVVVVAVEVRGAALLLQTLFESTVNLCGAHSWLGGGNRCIERSGRN